MNLYDLPPEGIITNSNIHTPLYIPVKRTNPNQFTKAHNYDAGFDILAGYDGEIPAQSSKLLSTGLYICIPNGYVGIIKSRSGLSVKAGIDVGAGVVDAGYTGEIRVLLRNTSDKWFDYKAGDKIAQMVVVQVPFFKVIDVVDFVGETERGSNGFGSTGK